MGRANPKNHRFPEGRDAGEPSTIFVEWRRAGALGRNAVLNTSILPDTAAPDSNVRASRVHLSPRSPEKAPRDGAMRDAALFDSPGTL